MNQSQEGEVGVSDAAGYEHSPAKRGHEILSALQDHQPDHVYAAVSGGTDSTTALHFARHSQIELDGILHVDTGIGIPEARAHVEELGEKWDLPVVALSDSNVRYSQDQYRTLVKLFGFPGSTIHAHRAVRNNLKDKPFAEFESHLDGQLALISGVRKHESNRRYEKLSQEGLQVDGQQPTPADSTGLIWASPLLDFTDSDINAYREKHDIPDSELILCASGECLCGAFENREVLTDLEAFHPEVAHEIFQLEWEVVERAARGEVRPEYALWAHGSQTQAEQFGSSDADQQFLGCADCEESCDGPYQMTGDPLSPAERFLQENGFDDVFTVPFYCAICDRVVESPFQHRQQVHPFDSNTGVAGEWDMRRIDPSASAAAGYPVTEPNGWHVDINQLVTDKAKAARSAHRYYYEEISLSHCDDQSHAWRPYNDGPVQQCTDCHAFNLREYTTADAGPPVVDPADDQSATQQPTTASDGQALLTRFVASELND